MINTQMRTYNYFAFGADNEYGQPELSKEPVGTIKMAINLLGQNTVNTIHYTNAKYIGITQAKVDDAYVIEYKGSLLKVAYINDMGRYKLVYLNEY